MNLVQNAQHSNTHHHNQIIASIQSAFNQLSDTLQLQPTPTSQNPPHQKIRYITSLHFKQLAQKIKILWQFKILSHVLIIKISLIDQQTIAQQIQSLCRKNRQKVIYYCNHINNISFSQNDGEFYVHGQAKIVYQYRQDNWYAFSKSLKLKYHLQHKIKKIGVMFRKNMENFLIKFKLLPNVEIQKKQVEKINQLNQIKYFFEENKKNPFYPPQMYQNMLKYRKNFTQIDFNKISKSDQRIFTLIEAKSPSIKSTIDSNLPLIYNQQIKFQFKSKISHYINNNNTNNDTNTSDPKDPTIYPLVIAMQILQIKNEITLKDNGGFGQITRGLYSCKYGKTIYDDINKQLQTENYFSQQIFNRYLCKKSSLSQKCQAFQNQKQALMKLRNKKSPYIAQYYCNISKGKPFDDGNIYMDVYSNNIDQIPIKLKHKFKILDEIIRGLYFLNSNGILHRDMKPQNVVIDRQMNSKIIDFGSCSNIYQRQDLFKPYDSKLRSTKGFFIRYQTYQSTLDKKALPITKQQFYQHYFFDIYSYGKIVEKLFNLGEYQFVQEDVVMSQVLYLSQKCCEANPADRLAHEEILFFLEKIVELEKEMVT